jgi:hypothetical protein
MLESINYSILRSNELLTFGQRTISIFNELKNDDPFYSFRLRTLDALLAYSKSFEREHKNPFTAELAEKNTLRESAFFGFRNYIVACTFHWNPIWSAAATKIVDVIRKHAWTLSAIGYKAKTAAFTNIVDELKSKYLSELALILAGEWLGNFESTQSGFEEVQKQSITRVTGNEPTIMETRPKLISAIKELFRMVDLKYSDMPGDTKLKNYVNALNELILITMSPARANVTRQSNKKKTNGNGKALAVEIKQVLELEDSKKG